VLLDPDVLEYKVRCPIAVLKDPVVLQAKAEFPIAVLLHPNVLANKARFPIAVLWDPDVLVVKAPFPIAVLKFPTMLEHKDPLPAAKFPIPVAEELKFVVAPIEMFEGTFPPPKLTNKPLIVPFEPDVEIEPVTPKDPVICAFPVKGKPFVAKLELKAYEELIELDAKEDEGAIFSVKSASAIVGLNQYSSGYPLPVMITVIPTYRDSMDIDPVAWSVLRYGPNLESIFLVVLTVKLSIIDIAMIYCYVNI